MTILLFGKLGSEIGRELQLEAGEPATIGWIRRELARLYPHCAGDLGADRARIFVNDRIAAEDQLAEEADEVAVLPPLSGG